MLIKSAIKDYNNAKFAFIQRFSQSEDGIIQETNFLDDKTIQSKIERLKKEFSQIGQEIELLIKYDKQDSNNTKKLKEFLKRKNEISLNIAFLGSNSLNNLDNCEEIIKDLNTDFKLCIRGLRFYKNGEYLNSFECFYEYFNEKSGVMEHYLINKVYGLLLYKNKQYKMAVPLLRKAVERRPEDIESHRILKEVYSILNMKQEEKIEQNILEVLGD